MAVGDALRALAARARPDPGRRQLAGAGDARRRPRRAAVRAPRLGRRASRRPTATPLPRLGACPGGRCCSGTPTRRRVEAVRRGRARRDELRRADRARGRARRRDRRRRAVDREGAARLLRHRGRAERDPARARASPAATAILKFAGCYHGHVDALLASAGSGLATLGIPSTPGVPTAVTATRSSPVQRRRRGRRRGRALRRGPRGDHRRAGRREHGRRPAGARVPRGAARALRRLGRAAVFDEVITGFRVARGGAQERFGVTPDLTILGKILGGGLPLAAFGGRADVMDAARAGRRRLPGGHAVREPARDRGGALGAAAAARPARLRRARAARRARSRRASRRSGRVQRVGSMLTLFAGRDEPVRELRGRAGSRHRALRARSSGTCSSAGSTSRRRSSSALFVSLAHGDEEIERTVEAVGDFFGRD